MRTHVNAVEITVARKLLYRCEILAAFANAVA